MAFKIITKFMAILKIFFYNYILFLYYSDILVIYRLRVRLRLRLNEIKTFKTACLKNKTKYQF
jgi:hypothetical protein